MMDRRSFIAGVALTLVAAPRLAGAQTRSERLVLFKCVRENEAARNGDER